MNRLTYNYLLMLFFTLFMLFSLESTVKAETTDNKYRILQWEELLPEGWQSDNAFKELDLNSLSDNDPNAQKAMETYLEQGKKAPVNPALQGKSVEIDGFVVPLDWDNEARLSEFLLVPYFGACIHVPPPPQNQIIYVRLSEPQANIKSMDTVSVYGTIKAEEGRSEFGTAAYTIHADKIMFSGEYGASNYTKALGITFLSGFSICFGLILRLIVRQWNDLLFCFGISLSAGIMFFLGASTLLAQFSWTVLVLFFLGALSMVFIHRLHSGKVHEHLPQSFQHVKGYAAFAIALHNIPECFAVFSAAMANPALGLALGGAMIAHNVPLGISVVLPSHEHARKHRLNYVILAGIIPPLTAYALYIFARSLLSPANLIMIFAFVGGVMTFIAVRELIPSARHYGRWGMVISGFLSGVFLMFAILLFVPFRG